MGSIPIASTGDFMASSMTRIASRGNTYSLEAVSSSEENTAAAETYPESASEEIAADPIVETPHKKKPPKKKITSTKALTSEPEISNTSPEPEAPVTVKDEVLLTEEVSNSKKKRKTEKTK